MARECAAIDGSPSLLHRLLSWRGPRVRRVYLLGGVGLLVFIVSWPFIGWHLAALTAWNVTVALFLASAWRLIASADSARTKELSTAEDETRRTAGLIVLVSTLVSVLAVVYTLSVAEDHEGWAQLGFVVAALVTIVGSWTTLNTLFTLRYADIHYRSTDGGVEFGDPDDHEQPDYRDFAYLAFTVGMCYQVSDQLTRSRHLRRVVLVHSVVSYAFGVVIIAASINVLAGFIQ